MNKLRPQTAAFMAFALAAVVLLSSVFDFSGLLRMRLAGVAGPEGLPFLPGLVIDVVLVSLPLILWVVLYAALWPLVSATNARPFMVAALVALLPATIFGVLAVLLPPFTTVALFSGVAALARVFDVLFGLLLAIALWRSGLFSVWVVSLAVAWAGLGVIALGMGTRTPPSAGFAVSIPVLAIGYAFPVLLTAFLVLLGRELLASEVCLTSASS
jgi:hypothetical protein